MPVPVSPCKDESSQSASASIPGAMTTPMQEAAHTPPASAMCSETTDDAVDPDVIAGYQDCLKETLRFLLEEEQLSMDHPVVMGLAAHLTRDHAHVELGKLSQELTNAVLACTPAPPPSSSVITSQTNCPETVSPISQRTVSAGYELTLVEGSDDSESDSESSDIEDIECDDDSDSEAAHVTEAIMGDPELRRQLLRYVYQGCDLIAAPQPVPELYQGLTVQF